MLSAPLFQLNFAPSGKLCTQPFAQPLPVNFWSGLACRRSPAALRNPMWNEARNGPGENMATTGGDQLILDHMQRKVVFQPSRFRCHISIGQCNPDGATGTILPERLKRVCYRYFIIQRYYDSWLPIQSNLLPVRQGYEKNDRVNTANLWIVDPAFLNLPIVWRQELLQQYKLPT